MRKVILATILVLNFSCTKTKYGTIEPYNIWNIHFYQDFEDDVTGEYREYDWEKDWNYPDWANRDILQEIIQVDEPENQTKVMRWHFPEGSVGPSEGGGQWFTGLDSVYNELYFSYKVRFKPGFKWVLGGKLPGVIGGPQWDGYAPPGWSDGFVAKLMWKSSSQIMFYYYHQDQNDNHGDSKTWDYFIESGRWYIITIRIVMNTINASGGNNDGILEGYIDGKMVCQLTNVRFRNLESIGIDHLHITSFFGGNSEEWAAQRDEWIDTDDFYVFTYKDYANVPNGNTISPPGRTIVLP